MVSSLRLVDLIDLSFPSFSPYPSHSLSNRTLAFPPFFLPRGIGVRAPYLFFLPLSLASVSLRALLALARAAFLVFHHWPLTLFLAAVVQPSSLSLPLGEPPLIRNTYGLSFATIHNPCSRNPFSIRPRSLASFVLPTGLNSLLRRIGRNLTTLFRT